MILAGIHPVAEALRAGRPIERVLVARGAGGPRLQEIIDLARHGSVPLRFEPRPALDRLAGTAAHQGVVALGGPHPLEEIEREHVLRVLASTPSLDEASKILGVDASTLYRKRKKWETP